MINLFGSYTKWEVLETYNSSCTSFCVQVRMNKKTGFKQFKVTRITGRFHSIHHVSSIDNINEKTKEVGNG